jgi:hypothetical protein
MFRFGSHFSGQAVFVQVKRTRFVNPENPACREVMADSPKCLRFHPQFALHPIYNLGTEDDFEIGSTPVGAGAVCQLFQTCFIGQEFTGRPGSAARNSCRNQNYLPGAIVSEAGGDCIVFKNLTPWSLSSDLPGA